jgi:hypothetical protein
MRPDINAGPINLGFRAEKIEEGKPVGVPLVSSAAVAIGGLAANPSSSASKTGDEFMIVIYRILGQTGAKGSAKNRVCCGFCLHRLRQDIIQVCNGTAEPR